MRKILALCIAVALCAAAHAAAAVENFSFMQISDIHVSPWLEGVQKPPALRGADSIAWIRSQAAAPQDVTPLSLTCTPPAFAIATGDLTEFGVTGQTWKGFEDAFRAFPCPLYILPGNHDDTWVALLKIMHEKYGGADYSFDHGGIHFVCLNSATAQEPVPTINATTRTWLRKDLGRLPPNTPIVIALHHPYDSTEFAPHIEQDTFGDFLRDYNIALIIYGHGHNVEQKTLDGFQLVMGGSTFGPNAGYMLYNIADGQLTVAYHYFNKGEDQQPLWKPLLQMPIPTAAPRRLFDITVDGDDTPTLRVVPHTGGAFADLRTFSVELDGTTVPVSDRTRIALPTDGLKPGWHFVSVRGVNAAGVHEVRTASFPVVDAERWHTRRFDFQAAFKAGPVLAGDLLVLADLDGMVRAYRRDSIDREDAKPASVWGFDDRAEILGTPVWTGQRLILGGGGGMLYALRADVRDDWQTPLKAPLYASPVVADGAVYVGDNAGRMHAVDLASGTPRWTFAHADYAIEAPACVYRGLVIFGAWDGYLYACRQDTGELAWKSWGPKSSDGKGARYYAPADCAPLGIGDSIFVCDRGYLLGRYDLAGNLQKVIAEQVSAIGLDAAGTGFIARGLNDHVRKFDASGNPVWDTEVSAGRFPVPPTCVRDTVYVCSNTGLLSALAADDGHIRWQFQCTPGSYVMAPVTVGPDGTCYVASMDGHLTVVRPR